LKQEDNELPVVVIGNNILGESLRSKGSGDLVKSYTEKGGVPWPSFKSRRQSCGSPAPLQKRRSVLRRLCMGLFFTKGCLHCEGVKGIKGVVTKFPD